MTQRYETYKDSGVQWLGEIPGHWKTIRVKSLLSERVDKSTTGLEEPLSMSQKVGIIPTKEMDVVPNMASSYIGAKKVFKSDLVFNKLKAHLGVFAISQYDGLVSPDYAVYTPNELVCLPFMEYAFHTKLYIGEFRRRSTGVAIGLTRLYTPGLFAIPFVYPPLSEQHAIVSYLDDKCGKIDEWVAQKQKEVEYLGELKQRIIADAVTRGLKPNVTMKQTNIPWLPEVPAHWEIKKVKTEFCFTTGFTPDTGNDNFYCSSGGVDWVTISDILSNGKIASNTKKQISDTYVATHKVELSRKGSLIYSFKLSVGQVAILDRDCYTNEAIATFSDPDERKLRFLYYSSRFIENNANVNIYGAKILNQRRIMDAILPFPPHSEQKQIADYLDDKTSKIDKLIANINKEIENIKEYKQRLISDVVTGQIKVC